MIRMTTPVAAAALALLLGACADSGDAPDGDGPATEQISTEVAPPTQNPGSGMPPGHGGEMSALVTEFQQIQERLNSVQTQALADPEILAQQETLRVHVEAVIEKTDPDFKDKQGRLEQLQTDMMAAQQSGDQETMQSIAQQGSSLQAELQMLQSGAVQDETIAKELDTFRENVQKKMEAIDPEVPELVERANEIAAQMQPPTAGALPGAGDAGAPAGE